MRGIFEILVVLGLSLVPLIRGQDQAATSLLDEVDKSKLEEIAKEEVNLFKALVPEGPQNGPTLFYDEENFLLKVTTGIKVHVFSSGGDSANNTGSTVGKQSKAKLD